MGVGGAREASGGLEGRKGFSRCKGEEEEVEVGEEAGEVGGFTGQWCSST